MWWRLSTAPGSDPATKPRARAVIHKARWVSEAEFRFRGSATGLGGANCVLQPPNIFPEWPDEASDQGGTSVSLTAPYFSPCQISLCPETLAQIHRERRRKKKEAKRTPHKMSVVGEKKPLAVLHRVRKSVAAPREVKKYHKSSYKNNQKHSLKKLGQSQTAMEKSWLAPIPLVPLFSLFLSFSF